MVSPADVPASRDFNGLICPAPANALSERKRQFSELSSLRRFAFQVATLHALVAEEEVRADPVEVFRLRCHSRAKLWHDGEIDLHSAVDELQHAAEASGLIDAIGQAAAHGTIGSAISGSCHSGRGVMAQLCICAKTGRPSHPRTASPAYALAATHETRSRKERADGNDHDR
jgi:hypothetical protein